MKAKTLLLLCCLSAFSSAPLHAQAGGAKAEQATPEAQLLSLATATGALSGGVLFGTYLGLVHVEEAHHAKLGAKKAEMQIARHLAAAAIMTSQIGQLRKAFAADQAFIAYLDQLEMGVKLLTSQGDALRGIVKGVASREEAQYELKKELTRKFLVELLKLPENREVVP
jgi:hypothetical protein